MELLSPGVGLIFWTLFTLVLIGFPVIALIRLLRSGMDRMTKLIWAIIIVFLPVAGAILYFFLGRKQTKLI